MPRSDREGALKKMASHVPLEADLAKPTDCSIQHFRIAEAGRHEVCRLEDEGGDVLYNSDLDSEIKPFVSILTSIHGRNRDDLSCITCHMHDLALAYTAPDFYSKGKLCV